MDEAIILGLTAALQSVPAILQAAQAIQASGSGSPTALADLNAAIAGVRALAISDVNAVVGELEA
jgi:hypothetical protein